MRNKNGFIVVEFLVATILFSLAGSGLYISFMQGSKAKARIEQSFKAYDPFRQTFIRMEKDLRNAITLNEYPFKGKEKEIMFPLRFRSDLLLIRYFIKDNSLVRSEQKLTSEFSKERPAERVLVKEVEEFRFFFPHHNEEDDAFFEAVWLGEPYYGLPRAVTIEMTRNGTKLEKTVSIPQGKWGYLNV